MHKIITITGLDRVGKETQSRLLTEVLKPSKRMTAPDYNHWSGNIINNILHNKSFYVSSELVEFEEGVVGPAVNSVFSSSSVFKQPKHPQILQLLHTINTYDKQPLIRKGLESHHWVMDRYIEDALAYGLVDGCSLDFLLELNRNFIPSDLVIVMLGQPYPRPGEVPDINERDTTFQNRVWDTYSGLLELFPNWKHIDTDVFNSPHSMNVDPFPSMLKIHEYICAIVSQELDYCIVPLILDELKCVVRSWSTK